MGSLIFRACRCRIDGQKWHVVLETILEASIPGVHFGEATVQTFDGSALHAPPDLANGGDAGPSASLFESLELFLRQCRGFYSSVFLLSRRAASGSAHAWALQTWFAVSLGQWTADRSRAQRPRPRKCRYDSNHAFPDLPIPRRTHSQLPGPSGILCLKRSAQILQP